MKDFLDNLIDRHTSTSQEIAPRLPSFFEREVANNGWDVVTAGEDTIDIEESTTDIFSPQEELEPLHIDSVLSQPRTKPTESDRLRPIVTQKPPTTPTTDINHQTDFASVTATKDIEKKYDQIRIKDQVNSDYSRKTVSRDSRKSIAGPHTVTPSSFKKGDSKRRQRPAETRPTEPTAEKGTPTPISQLDQAPAVREGILLAQQYGAKERPTENATKNVATSTFVFPSTRLMTPELSSAANKNESDRPADPVINITIGRIEVRATPAATKQTPKPANRKPAMSLDEYLQRRSGGNDR